jgi:hypothetical protein
VDDEAAIAKPDELLALSGVAAELFETLRRWFDVPGRVTLDLSEVDSAVTELGDPVLVAAMAMRKLQALHLLTAPQVATTTDVVLTLVQDLERPLRQAPRARLRRQAARTDWDAELRALEEEVDDGVQGLLDEESLAFREAHRTIRAAAQAVLRASDGQIRRLG